MKKPWLVTFLVLLLALAPVASAAEAPGRLGQLFTQLLALLAGGESEIGVAYPPNGVGVQYPPNGFASELEKDPHGLGIEHPPGGAASPGNEDEIGVQYPPHGLTSRGPQSEIGEQYPPHG